MTLAHRRRHSVPRWWLAFLFAAAAWAPWAARGPSTVAAEPEVAVDIFAWDQAEPAVAVPTDFARILYRLIQCESRWDRWKIGANGELGLVQIHPIHFRKMRNLGLEPTEELHRLVYAGWVIFPRQGLAPWDGSLSCREALEAKDIAVEDDDAAA